MITVVDYGVGNISSLLNMYDYLGIEAQSSSDKNVIISASHLILPGIGAFDKAMATLINADLVEPVKVAAECGSQIMGVCLGMHLLANHSEEGKLPGLGMIDAEVVRINIESDLELKIPHMGWANIDKSKSSDLFPDADSQERFYFAHSYYLSPASNALVSATVNYGKKLCVAVSQGNIHGVQFHPEKSHKFGMRLMKAFAEL
jgi:imidazole glycerol-phosphate synthase subunit HisH